MDEEKMILSHEPVPGYRKVFCVSVVVSFLYLSVLFFIYYI
jgi:hypothetical protein